MAEPWRDVHARSERDREGLLVRLANDAYIVGMAILNIRNLPDEVHRRLRVRAAEHGRSMEAEARAILTAACVREQPAPTPEERAAALSELQRYIDGLYGGNKPKSAVDDLIAERRREAAREAANR